MESILNLYRIGKGPSSSHTMGPQRAAKLFQEKNPQADAYEVTLYSSLAATGRGHLTDKAILEILGDKCTLIWKADTCLPLHPNGMKFEALSSGKITDTWEVYSVGGGALSEENDTKTEHIYQLTNMDSILKHCRDTGKTFWEFVIDNEGVEILDYMQTVWNSMKTAIKQGLNTEGVLDGGLGLGRKASTFYRKAKTAGPHFKRSGLLTSYALAVSEENAGGGIVVTAPTCGACGVLPAVLRYLKEVTGCHDIIILRALLTAGLIGNIIKFNGSISGAEVGCQGEIGSACSMAAGAAVQILGGSIGQIEYAAEMGLEHHLGLTCDPVAGLVQIPCIERNSFAAKRALSCADHALLSDGVHRISFDQVISVMTQTGHDLPSLYRETAEGGLAAIYNKNCGCS